MPMFRPVFLPRPPFIFRRYPFKGRKQMLAALGSDLARPVVMRRDDSPPGETAIGKIFDKSEHIHKLRHYLPIYERFLPGAERMLEIGVDRGGSLKMWREFLPDTTIVGLDINQNSAQFDDPERDVHVRIGDQTDTSFLSSVDDEFGPFDVILDDGGHTPNQMISSFQFLFPRLKPGGVYLVEDVCANYWMGYRDRPDTFIDFTKTLMDAIHAPYMALRSPFDFMEEHPDRVDHVQVPFAATIVDSIQVFDSVVVVHRSKEPKPLPRTVYR
ncbi:putative O-methyltransferase [Mycolicibacterium smegmatis]|nr:putative O-methyltransferase [Mycolicibacterium smegmatis]